MTNEIITVSETRKNLLKIIKELEQVETRYIITRGGKPSAVLMSFDEYFRLIATLDILCEQDLVKGISDGLKDLEAGRVFSFEDVFGEPF
nr:type II toxin-antitoxin system Phd/YefM family antitoxin [Desulfobacterales bacterium]